MKSNVFIESLSFGGEGIARIDGKVCFVIGALPGEKVEIEVLENKKHFYRAKTTQIIERSLNRIISKCPYSFDSAQNRCYCDGCTYQHVNYETELQSKNRQFKDLLQRIGKIDECNTKTPLYSNSHLSYRNKITLQSDNNGRFGYVSNNNKNIIPIKKCELAVNQINDAIKDLNCQKEIPRKIIFRYTETDGVSVLNSKLDNQRHKTLTEKTNYGTFKVNLGSFFQTNICGLNLLMEEVSNVLDSIYNKILIDCYSGVGVFGILAAKKGFTPYFTDIDDSAISIAKENSFDHKVKNPKFLAGDISRVFLSISDKVRSSDACVLVDPPRTGLDKVFLDIICTYKPADIIYISCSPDTLCRDIKELIKNSYCIVSTRVVDMFPRTKHFETITHLKILK